MESWHEYKNMFLPLGNFYENTANLKNIYTTREYKYLLIVKGVTNLLLDQCLDYKIKMKRYSSKKIDKIYK